MAETSKKNSSGLVKKLLFPAYADSGSNDTFRKEGSAVGSVTTGSITSDASTLVQNNLSTSKAVVSLSNSNNNDEPQADSTPSSSSGSNFLQQPKTPSFFASTKPTVVHQQQSPQRLSETTPTLQDPESPPKLPRKLPPATRSLSTLVSVDGDDEVQIAAASRALEESLAEQEEKTDSAEHDVVKQQDKSEPASTPPGQQVQSENEDGTVTPPRSGDSKTSNDSSAVRRARNVWSRVKGGDGDLDEAEDGDNHYWEEEATPAQTAFGKELMFRRDEMKQDAGDTGSDVLSTASEMGTVVENVVDRLAEVEAMEETSDHNNANEAAKDDDGEGPLTPKRSNYSASVWEEEDSCLSLPILDGRPSKSNDEEEKKVPDKEMASPGRAASAMLSKAIRTIGSGMAACSVDSSSARISMSEPSTPRSTTRSPDPRYDTGHRSPRRYGDNTTLSERTPSSFLLRSPGSSARIAAKSSAKKSRVLSPRFARERHGGRTFDRIPEDEEATEDVRSPPKLSSTNAFLLARSCFSFDAYDTSMDELYEVPVPREDLPKLPRDFDGQQYSNRLARGSHHQQSEQQQALYPGSSSWDVGGSSRAPAFRPSRRSFVRNRAVFPNNGYSTPPVFASPQRPSPERLKMMSDYSPIKAAEAVEVKSPQRIEIEREDALDILACLVERGVSLRESDSDGNESEKLSSDVAQAGAKAEDDDDESRSEGDKSYQRPDITTAISQLKELSSADASDKDGKEHRQRLLALDELVRSHDYALEMRRASKSASFWLKSIGRSNDETKEGSPIPPTASKPAATDTADSVDSQPAGETASEGLDVLTAKAMLHSAQLEVQEKAMLADRLNEELAECRAEIGRLRSAANGPSFRSPNRSILDETDETSTTGGDEEEVDKSFETNASPILNISGYSSNCLDSSFEDIIPLRQDKSDLLKFQSALEEANDMIRKLHADLKKKKSKEEDEEDEEEGTSDVLPEEAPVVEIKPPPSPLVADNEEATASTPPPRVFESPGNKEERTVNVRMLDAENYVTDWDELASPLPPPPDHGLRSPIVAAVLEQWTMDRSLHESLLSWIEQVLSGGDPNSIPPLTLSSLDHQVRDGFTTHVLPLLLRRPDIRVDVKMRAHRRTTYDIAVTVDRLLLGDDNDAGAGVPLMSSSSTAMDVRRHLETTSAQSDVGVESTTHSSATALISNSAGRQVRNFSYAAADDDEYHHQGSSSSSKMASPGAMTTDGATGEPGQQAGIMSALGGALGGLLARRKPVPDQEATPSQEQQQQSMQEAVVDLPSSPTFTNGHDTNNNDGDEEEEEERSQPYHRVVAAPPGRLCITFVEYRGHAMVSDVAPDSPLVGWIFPSDILIAIDELPVSGMRVRDIIKVLKDRVGRQRALRVISSHDMTEFTMNTSILTNDGPS